MIYIFFLQGQDSVTKSVGLLVVGMLCGMGQCVYQKTLGCRRACLESAICRHRGRNSRMTPEQLHAISVFQLGQRVQDAL